MKNEPAPFIPEDEPLDLDPEQTEPTPEAVKDEMDAGMVAAMADLADATARLEKFQDTTPTWGAIAQADLVALLQDLRRRLGMVESQAATNLGKSEGPIQGNLSDGRQFTLKRTQDRKAWDHDDWKRDARRVLVTRALEGEGLPRRVAVIDAETGEAAVDDLDLAGFLHQFAAALQEVHGSTAPRSTALKGLGLYAGDYCESSPGGWKFDAIAPKPTETTTEKDA